MLRTQKYNTTPIFSKRRFGNTYSESHVNLELASRIFVEICKNFEESFKFIFFPIICLAYWSNVGLHVIVSRIWKKIKNSMFPTVVSTYWKVILCINFIGIINVRWIRTFWALKYSYFYLKGFSTKFYETRPHYLSSNKYIIIYRSYVLVVMSYRINIRS